MSDIDDFLAAMWVHVPERARVLGCMFRGDPNAEIAGKWRAKVIRNAAMLDEGANCYLCVSAMGRNERGEFRRRRDNFVGGLLLMIDDVGTGAGAKFPMSVLDPLAPTALIETSQDNYQAMYFFDRCWDDAAGFDALIRAFIRAQFLSADPGQAGINRVFRPPTGVNGKPKHEGWRVRLTEWHPERRYAPEDIAEAFSLTLERPQRYASAFTDRAANARAWLDVYHLLRSAGMLKAQEPDLSGWIPVRCPWIDDHTDRADSGAAIRVPHEENGFVGGFRCHHGHCEDKAWRDLTEHLAANAADVLADVNDAALGWEDYNLEGEDEQEATGERAGAD